jgi:hypothetical protein
MSLVHKMIINCLLFYCYKKKIIFCVQDNYLKLKIEFYKHYRWNNTFVLFHFTYLNRFLPKFSYTLFNSVNKILTARFHYKMAIIRRRNKHILTDVVIVIA